MKYRNAAEILPDDLLRQIQRYAAGETLYIPSEGKRKAWGAGSGAKIFYQQRNEEIRCRYSRGASLEELCRDYSLSYDTIRKIVYTAK